MREAIKHPLAMVMVALWRLFAAAMEPDKTVVFATIYWRKWCAAAIIAEGDITLAERRR